MAAIAIRRRPREDVVDVATCTGHCNVSAGERERRRAVVECRAKPVDCGVAHRTVRWEARGGVVWIGRRVVCRQMACRARGRRQSVVIVDVTLRARRGQMRPGKCKSRRGVIECCAEPIDRRVT